MERHRVVWLRVAILAVVLALGRFPGGGPLEADTTARGAPRAVDGDTIQLISGERLRLVGVDCPETGRPGAEQARLETQTFLDRAGPGSLVLEPATPERDRYGRILADLRVQGESLSTALVEAGLAWAYRSSDRELVEAQARAVRLRRGVHAILDHPVSEGPFVLTGGSFHRPACSILRGRAGSLPWAQGAADPLAQGKAPCRRCLAWPPEPPFGAPRITGQPGRDRSLPGG